MLSIGLLFVCFESVP